MKFFGVFAVVLLVGLVSALPDCGCLKCGKNLHVISKPNAPITMIYRGELCHCPKPIPYRIEVPQREIQNGHPLKTYGYCVQQRRVIQPQQTHQKSVSLNSHGYKIEVPVQGGDFNGKQYKYFVNLVAKPDRCVIDGGNGFLNGCRLPKPCADGPVLEYLPYSKSSNGFEVIDDDECKVHNLPRPKRDLGIFAETRRRRFFRFLEKPTTKIKEVFGRESRAKNHLEHDKTPNDGQGVGPFEKVEKRSKNPSKRSIDSNQIPFYQVSGQRGQNGDEVFEGASGGFVNKRKPYLKPFDIESLMPHNQLFYVINFPIRALNHFRMLKEHVSPMVKSVPKVMSTSSNYLVQMGKRMKKGALSLFGGVLGALRLNKLFRNKRDVVQERPKRAILKLVDPEDVHDFFKNKLSSFFDEIENVTPSSEELLLTPITPEDFKGNNNKKEDFPLVIKKLTPKIFIDKGKPFLDVQGIKKKLPIRIKKSHKSNHDHYTVKEEINDLIEEAKQISENSIKKQKTEDIPEVPLQTVKTKIKETLDFIQSLIQIDFTKSEAIYEELVLMENLKKIIVKEWKTILEKHKYKDMNIKISLLNKMKELLSKKEDIVELIAESLTEETKNFNTNNLIKILVRLQKLQCILGKSVEEFGETMKYKTPVDVSKESEHLTLLNDLILIKVENRVDLCAELRKQRDIELEKEVELLDNLKDLLECEICEDKSKKIDEIAKVLWEINNIGKIQKETLIEMHEKIQYGMKIRRELKIVFDLQKHLGSCCEKVKSIFAEIGQSKLKNSIAKRKENQQTTTPRHYN